VHRRTASRASYGRSSGGRAAIRVDGGTIGGGTIGGVTIGGVTQVDGPPIPQVIARWHAVDQRAPAR
jgi:hypothetical protein